MSAYIAAKKNGKQKKVFSPLLFCARFSSRSSQSGNIFFTLFGAVAIVGLLGAVVVATIRGPLTTMVEVQNRAKAEAEMSIASRLVLVEAAQLASDGDCDADGFVEPLEYVDAGGAGPVGGGFLPGAVASSQRDPWGTNYGYCAWDAGSSTGTVGCDIDSSGTNLRLDGNTNATDETYTVIALISAGPDQVFDTTCAGGASPSISKNGDDIVTEFTYAQARASADGLWNLKSGDPATAEISKDLEVTGGATFTAGIDLTGSSAALQLGAASMLFPNETSLSTCNAANDGLVRINTTTTPDRLELCDDPVGWISVAGAQYWVGGTGEDIYYNVTGSPQVGIGTNSPSEALQVVGNILASGSLSGGNITGTGNAAIGGTLGVTGTSTLSILNATGAVDFDSTLNTDGAVTFGSTLGVTGTSTLSILNATGAVDFDSTLNTDGAVTFGSTLGVTGTSTLSILNATGAVDFDSTLNVDGSTTLRGTVDARGTIADSTGNVTIGDDTDITGDLDVSGDVSAGVNVNAGTAVFVNGDQLGPPLTCTSTQKLEWNAGAGWSCAIDLQGGAGGGVPALDDLTDVVISSPNNNDCLVYDSGDGQWENTNCSSTGIFENTGGVIRLRAAAGTYLEGFVIGSTQFSESVNTSYDARMYYDKTKASFRAGFANGSEWDFANVGSYSFAGGYNTRASGLVSTAFGAFSVASGTYSFAVGNSTTASNDHSIAMGIGSAASGQLSTSIGPFGVASGYSSLALGSNGTANGYSSAVITTSAARTDGDYSLVLGRDINISATGDGSMGIGLTTTAPATDPIISGTQSFGIFMGDQSGYNLSAANRMALIGGDFMIDDVGATGSQGCFRYNGGTSTLQFSHDCTTFLDFSGTNSNVFEVVGGAGTERVRTINANAPHATSDFIFGSPQLGDTGVVAEDNRMFFDKSKAAFRAGAATSTQWDDANVGVGSVALGSDVTASGIGSLALGSQTNSSGLLSTASGYQTTASGNYSFAAGANTTASATQSLALGAWTTASGTSSTALGFEASATGLFSTVLGLGDATGVVPRVSGTSSLGIFMGDQSGYNLSVANRMGLVGGHFMVDDVGATGSQGCIRYNGATSKLEISNDCTTYVNADGSSSGVFEVTGAPGAEVVRTVNTVAPTATSDFVFGSSQLADTGNAADDNRMFFDKSKGAFRAGTQPGTGWDDSNVGLGSVAFGTDARASGNHSFTVGNSSYSSGDVSIALGQNIDAVTQYSVGIGNNADSLGIGAISIGGNSIASGRRSMTFGNAVTAGNGVGGSGFGNGSIGIGLVDINVVTVTANPQVRGTNAFGIFMGDQDGLVMTANNTMGLFGGNMVIDPNVPATQLAARSVLDLGAATDSIVMPAGTTAQRPGTPVNGMLRYDTSVGKFQGYQQGVWQDILTSGSGNQTALSSITAATATNTINNLNFAQVWNWNTLTTETAMTLASSSQTTGTVLNLTGSNNNVASTGAVASVNVTGVSNAATPLMITNAGTGNSLRVNDDGTITDSTPFVVNAAGNVGVGTASPAAKFHMVENATTVSSVFDNSGGPVTTLTKSGAQDFYFIPPSTSGGITVITQSGGSTSGNQHTDIYPNAIRLSNGGAGLQLDIARTASASYFFDNLRTDGGLIFRNNGTNRMYVAAAGVSIGATADQTAPRALLDVNGGDFLTTGTYSGAGTAPVTGAGTRMFFDVSRGAFRAGAVATTEWDTIGNYSFASGYSSSATGVVSTALGQYTVASGNGATAMGDNTTASGYNSTAMGYGTLASGDYSTAMGYGSQAEALYSTAIGSGARAIEEYSIAMGTNTFASSFYSTAIGLSTSATGEASTSIGWNTTASASASTAMGYYSNAAGDYSMAFGNSVNISATGDGSAGFGLTTADPVTDPVISGAQSFGVFMGNHSGVNFAAANTAAFFGGNLLIDPNVPATQITARGVIDVGASTGSVVLPRGTAAQRPGTPTGGMFRYNTTSTPADTLEYYDVEGATWRTLVASGAGSVQYIDDLLDARTDYTTDFNLFMGSNAGAGVVAGAQYNLAIGQNALDATLTSAADRNTAVGSNALTSNTDGAGNTALGASTLSSNTTGAYNVAVGMEALASNTTGFDNLAVGHAALLLNTTGSSNYAFGRLALRENTIGSGNIAYGRDALRRNTIGNYNTAIGNYALNFNVAGIDATAIGHGAMEYTNDTSIPFVTYNTALGAYALRGSTTASANTGIHNTALGHSALQANTTGGNNTGSGANALSGNTTGSENTALGSYAGDANSTGSNNTYIGSYANADASNYYNSTALGAYALITESNQIVFGDSNIVTSIFSGSGAVRLPNGTTAERPGTPSGGMFRYNTDATPADTIEYYDAEGATWRTMAASGAGNVALSSITAAVAANTIANGVHMQNWNWALTGATDDAFTFGETTAATNGTGTQSILKATTLATSTAVPFMVTNLGNGLTARFNDNAGDADTTPVVIDAAGNLGVGTSTPATAVGVVGDNSSVSVALTTGGWNYSGTTPIGAQFGAWDGAAALSRVAGIKFHRWQGSATNTTVAYMGQAAYGAGDYGLDFRIDDLAAVGDATTSRLFISKTGNIGVNNTTPRALFDVNGGDILVTGTYLGTGTAPVTGAGTRMFFDVSRAAFRAGNVTGTQWNTPGNYSVAMGLDTTASGSTSFAMGDGAVASGNGGIAIGTYVSATGGNSVALGANNVASAPASVSIGQVTTASGDASVAMGLSTTASGFYSTAMGQNTTASGISSFAAGDLSTASGDVSVAMGFNSTASAQGSTAIGDAATASGPSSTAMGVQTTAAGDYSTAMGRMVDVSSTGDGSMGVGLTTATPATAPIISGAQSFGVFMGNHSGVNFAAANTAAFFGGNLLIDPNVPATQLTARGVIDVGASTGAIVLPRGTTAQQPGTPTGGMFRYNTTSTPADTLEYYDAEGAVWRTLAASGAGGVALSSITAAVAANTIANGVHMQNWNWALTGATDDAFTFGETTAATNGAGTQSILKATTLATSTAVPFMVTNLGNGLTARFNDNAGDADTTPVVIDAAGNVGVGTENPSALLDVYNSGDSILAIDNTSDGQLRINATGIHPQSLTVTPRLFGGSSLFPLLNAGIALQANSEIFIGSSSGLNLSANGSAVQMLLNNAGNVGIATNTPQARLHVNDGDFLTTGTYSGTGTAPVTGAGTRMFFDVSRAAFRAGSVTGTQWDALGNYSFASGRETTAPAIGSTAMGGYSDATGNYSVALGEEATASGYAAVSIGSFTTASGNYATAFGFTTGATGSYATSMGINTGASGNNSVAMGSGSIASGITSTAIGVGSDASGSESVAMGAYNTASGTRSTAIGTFGVAAGESAITLGYNVVSNGYYSMALGRLVNVGTTTINSGGEGSMGIGLFSDGAAPSITPRVSGNESLGIFLGGDGAVFAADSTFGVFGGNMVIDPSDTPTQLDARSVIDAGAATDSIVLPRGTTAQRPGTPTGGMIRYNTTATPADTLEYYDAEGAVWRTVSASGASGVALSSISAATATNTIDSLNFAQTWNWSTLNTQVAMAINANALTSGDILDLASSSTAFTGRMIDVTLSGNNAANTGSLIRSSVTGASSAAVPLMVTNLGNGLTARFNDATGDTDTTPVVIDAAGNLGVGTATPNSTLHVAGVSTFGGTLTNADATTTALNIITDSIGEGGDINITSGNGGVNGGGDPYRAGNITITAGEGFLGDPDGSIVLATTSSSATPTGTIVHRVVGTDLLTIQTPTISDQASVIFGGNTAVILPAGTTAQRPNTPSAGMFRYNTTSTPSDTIEYYDAETAAWVTLAASGGSVQYIDDLLDAETDYTTDFNMWMGSGAGANIASGGQYNLAIGQNAGNAITTGDSNIALGYNALAISTTGSDKIAIGDGALSSHNANFSMVAIGTDALNNVTASAFATAIGTRSLARFTNADHNTAIGYEALFGGSTGSITGGNNTCVGSACLRAMQNGTSNVAMGRTAGGSTTTGSSNVAIGHNALDTNVAGSESTAVGYRSMYYANSSSTAFTTYNTAVGFQALMGSTTAASNTGTANTAIGHSALFGVTTGSNNTAIGKSALQALLTGSGNVAVGENTLASNLNGNGSIAIGPSALAYGANVFGQIAIGGSALLQASGGGGNIAIGSNAGDNLTSGSYNIMLGENARVPSISGSYQLNIGDTIFGDMTNDRIRIGGSGAVSAFSDLELAGTLALKLSSGTTAQRPGTPAGGMVRYNTTSTPSDTIEYYDAETAAWVTLAASSGSGSSVFEVTGSAGSEVVRAVNTVAPHATADFVFGSTQLADTGNAAHDSRMFFDKSKGAFRAGTVDGTQWDNANVGDNSVALSYNSIASGNFSFAFGWNASATADYGIAMGESAVANGSEAVAIGDHATSSGSYSTAIGDYVTATGTSASAFGMETLAAGDFSTTMGREVTVSGTGDGSMAIGLTSAAVATDPIVSGAESLGIFLNGQSGMNVTANNVMAVLGGNVLINPSAPTDTTVTPLSALHVVGDIRHTGIIIDASDIRYKTDIKPLTDRGDLLAKINQIDTYSFRMKDDPAQQIEFGVIAQQIETVFPELVVTDTSKDKMKSVNYIGLIAPLIEATKELKSENDDLKAKLASMDERLAALEGGMDELKLYTGFGVNKASMGIFGILLLLIMSGIFVTIRRKGIAETAPLGKN